MLLFRRYRIPGVFCMYTSNVSFISAVSTGDVALASLRIGEFAHLDKYQATVFNNVTYQRRPMAAIREAPGPKRHAIALLLLKSGVKPIYHNCLSYYIYTFDPNTIATCIKYGALKVDIYTVIRMLQPDTYCRVSVSVQMTLGGSYRQTIDYTDCDYAKGLLYGFRRRTFKKWSVCII